MTSPSRLLLACGTSLVLFLSACTPVDPPTTRSPGAIAQKQGDGVLREDLEPLTSRFPAIGSPVSAIWESGTMGSDDLPGPTTYWIDAVVTVSPESAAQLEALAEGGTESAPEVVDSLTPSIPDGTPLISSELDAALSQGDWSVRGWVIAGADTVVIAALGE